MCKPQSQLFQQFAARFPASLQRIKVEYECSEVFRALCEDMRLCEEALMRWQQSDAVAAPERVAEYSQWLVELEEEIETWLNGGVDGAL